MENLIREFVKEIQRLKEWRLEVSKSMILKDPDSSDYKNALEQIAMINKRLYQLTAELAEGL
jgi:uncharacterized protein YaaR (DUF327 family)